MHRTIPDFFIVGQAKSGTTALFDFLGRHPDVFTCLPKEPHFFCGDLHEESDRFFGKRKWFEFRTLDEYLRIFDGAEGHAAAGEASVHYIYSQTSAEEIAAFNPDARIIIMIREPVSFLHSLFVQKRNETVETLETLGEALEAEPERKRGRHLNDRVRFPSVLYYSERVRYAEQIRRFTERFPEERIRIILFDDFKADNERVYRETARFLGVDPSFTPDFQLVNAAKAPRSELLNRIVRSSGPRRRLKAMLPTSVYEPLQMRVQRLIMKDAEKPTLSAETRRELERRFAPEVEACGDLLGTDLLTRWGYRDL